jgi:uncharacterized protein (TIGR03437 family)
VEDPLKSCSDARPEGSECLGGGAIRLIAVILACAASAFAQSVAGSISTIHQPIAGHPVFDASGNTYYLSETAAAPISFTNGVCLGEGGFHGPVPVPCPAVLVTKVDPSGNQIWSARLGGPAPAYGTALAIASNGNVAFTGSTGGQFPTTPGAAIESSTSATAFAAMVSADGSKVLYSTYLPDSVAASSAIAVDAAGNAYIAGMTSAGHASIVKVSADGSVILYNVTLAGSGADAATAITVDPAGNAVVAGQTSSRDFPVTAGAFQRRLKGTQNGFLVRLDPSGSVLSSTYFGGSGSDIPSSVAVDGAGNIDLAGSTSSLDLPTTPGTMQTSAVVPAWNNSSPAGFVAQFAPDGISLSWASYVMSSESLGAHPNFDVGVSALAVGAAGDIYIGGLTGPGFPVTPSAPAICFQGSTNRTNGFLAHLDSNGALIDATYLGNSAGGDIDTVGGSLPLPGGSVLVAWHGSGNDVVSNVQFGSGGWTAPACLSSDVLNAATQVGTGGVMSGELISLTGFGIGPNTGVAYQPDAQGNVPTQLAGVQVLFDGAPVPIMYAQSRQINAIAPAGLTVNGTTSVIVTYNNQQFGPAVAQVAVASPGLFRLKIGESAQAAAVNQDGTLNGPMNPAPPGSVVAVWGTGYGQTSPSCQIGGLNLSYAAPLSPPGTIAYMTSITIQAAPAPVDYAGSAPGVVCGVQQINFQVPVDAPPGAFSFFVEIQPPGGDPSTGPGYGAVATIAVK